MPATELLKLLLIVIVIGLPPYLIALKTFKDINIVMLSLLSIVYWSGTIYTQQVVPFILIVIILIKEHRYKKKEEQFGFNEKREKSFLMKDFFLIIFLTLIIRFPIGLLNFFYVLLIEFLGINIQQQEVVDIFINSQNNLLNILLFLLVVVMAPLNEEFSMRHWLFGKVLSPKTGFLIAALISSSLFTLLHYNMAGVPTFFVLGFYACYVYHHKGFWGAVTVHFTFNFSSVILLLLAKYFIPIT